MTYIIEAMAIGNALNRNGTKPLENQPLLHNGDAQTSAPLSTTINTLDYALERDLSSYAITERIEMGRLSEMYLSWFGKIVFNAIIIVYLFGDLAMCARAPPPFSPCSYCRCSYAVAVPTSLQRLAPGWTWGTWTLSCGNSYYVYLSCFVLLVVPWAYFNFQKTKYLQIFTMVIRNTALFTYANEFDSTACS